MADLPRDFRADQPLTPSSPLEMFPLPTFAYPAYVQLPSIIPSDLKARRNALASYKDLKKTFLERGVSYNRQLFLRNLAARQKFEMKFEDLYQKVSQVANELLMEELEVALWGWYLDQVKESDLSIGEAEVLWILAYAAKQYFNTDTRIFENVCTGQIEGFTKLFEDWKVQSGLVTDISLAELNMMLATLSKPRTSPSRNPGRDYNAAVEELLSVPSHRSRLDEEEPL